MISTTTRLTELPAESKAYWHVMVAHQLDGIAGIRRAVRSRDITDLEKLEREISKALARMHVFLAKLRLPVPEAPRDWEVGLPIFK